MFEPVPRADREIAEVAQDIIDLMDLKLRGKFAQIDGVLSC